MNNQIGKIKNYEDKIRLLEKEIIERNIEIQNYKSDMNIQDNQSINSITSIKQGEKIMTIILDRKMVNITIFTVILLV